MDRAQKGVHDRAEIFRFQGGKIDQFDTLIGTFGKGRHAGSVVDANAMSQLYQPPGELIDSCFESPKASGNRFYPDHCNPHGLRFQHTWELFSNLRCGLWNSTVTARGTVDSRTRNRRTYFGNVHTCSEHAQMNPGKRKSRG